MLWNGRTPDLYNAAVGARPAVLRRCGTKMLHSHCAVLLTVAAEQPGANRTEHAAGPWTGQAYLNLNGPRILLSDIRARLDLGLLGL